MTARFAQTYCSQCGAELGPGDAGVSSEAADTYSQMQDALAHLIRWHDQLTPADIQRAKAILAKSQGEKA